jgi:hypothetical protein
MVKVAKKFFGVEMIDFNQNNMAGGSRCNRQENAQRGCPAII